jgi:hypothetical protein
MTTTRLTIARLNALTHPDRITMGAAAAEQAAHEMIEVIANERGCPNHLRVRPGPG